MFAEELKSKVIQLEGYELAPIELGHTDTDHNTGLHVRSIGLVVAGDAVYNDIHLYLAESSAQGRREWIAKSIWDSRLRPIRSDASGNAIDRMTEE
jgi:hypothetical protein